MLPAAPYIYAPAHDVRRMRLPWPTPDATCTPAVPQKHPNSTPHQPRACDSRPVHSARLESRPRLLPVRTPQLAGTPHARVSHSPYSMPRKCAGARRQWLPKRTKPYTTKFHAHTQHATHAASRSLEVHRTQIALTRRVGGIRRQCPRQTCGRVGVADVGSRNACRRCTTSGASALCRSDSMRCAPKARTSAPPSTRVWRSTNHPRAPFEYHKAPYPVVCPSQPGSVCC